MRDASRGPLMEMMMTIRSYPFGWLTPHLARLCELNPYFRDKLFAFTRGETHYLAMSLAFMGDLADDREALAWFAEAWPEMKRIRLLERVLDNAPSGIASLPPRLAGRLWRPATYRRLAEMMRDNGARKTLRHMTVIDRRHVFYLSRLPEAFRKEQVLRRIKRKGDIHDIVFAIEIVRRVRPDLTDRQIFETLARSKDSNIRSWVMRHYQNLSFPPAPWAGTEVLRPLTSYDDLADAAREFKNCIRTYLLAILRGDAFFYSYKPGGRPAAVVEVKKTPGLGWVVHEALGPDNERIGGVDRGKIIGAFAEAGITPAPQAVNPSVWFDLD